MNSFLTLIDCKFRFFFFSIVFAVAASPRSDSTAFPLLAIGLTSSDFENLGLNEIALLILIPVKRSLPFELSVEFYYAELNF